MAEDNVAALKALLPMKVGFNDTAEFMKLAFANADMPMLMVFSAN